MHHTDPSNDEAPAIDWRRELAANERWLRTVVLARCGERAAAEEILQEVSLAALRPQPRPSEPQRVAPWLYQVAVRQCLLYRRKRGRQRKLVESFSQNGYTTDSQVMPDALSWLLAEERREQLREALAQLPAKDREVLLLKYVENFNYRQLSEHLGISHHAVANRLRQARDRLKARLAHYELIENEP